ncbi:hypothetical protein EVAR_50911_1 [Eumeta japonica]|uniref:Uncharacterized protein n=1 Tax=Eumeta variegata TaxID=151549 RepID=A0A4C1YD92_EUMVA|nr:hypothetical protein EVAR_50911_1 [Eumeta japonica]
MKLNQKLIGPLSSSSVRTYLPSSYRRRQDRGRELFVDVTKLWRAKNARSHTVGILQDHVLLPIMNNTNTNDIPQLLSASTHALR